MSITVGDAILWLKTDESQMNRGLDHAESQVRSWGNRVGGFISNALSFATGTLLVQGVNKITGALSGVANEAFGAVSSYELMEKTFQSLVARDIKNTSELEARTSEAAGAVDGLAKSSISLKDAMAQAGPKAKELLTWVEKLAIKSPYSRQGVTDALQQVLTYGFDIETSKRYTKAMMDYVAGTGRSAAVMNRVALALGQIKAKGKLAGQEVLQLTEAGVDVRNILAKAFNVTTEELVAMQEKGLIPAADAVEAIIKSFEDDFAGAAEAQTHTWSGLTSTLVDVKDVLYRALLTPTLDAVKPYFITLVDEITSEETQEKIGQFGVKMGNVTQAIGTLLSTGKANDLLFQLGFSPESVGQVDAVIAKITGFVGLAKNEFGKLNEAYQAGGLVGLGTQLQADFGTLWSIYVAPEISTWPGKFWIWLTGPEGVLADATIELDKIPAKIKEWSDTIDWKMLGGDIGQAILDGITGKMGEDESGKRTISAFLKSLSNAVLTLDVEIYKAGQDIAYGLGQKISENIQSDFVRDLIKGSLSNLFGMLSPFGVFTPAVQGAQQAGILPEFAYGGIVPGPVGAPVIAKVHGGETIIPPGQSAAVQEVRITINTLNLNGVQDVSGFLAELEALS